jgi:phosphatidylinositol glycan class K
MLTLPAYPPPQFDKYDFDEIHSHGGVRSDLFERPLNEVLITDFFGGVVDVSSVQTSSTHSPRGRR